MPFETEPLAVREVSVLAAIIQVMDVNTISRTAAASLVSDQVVHLGSSPPFAARRNCVRAYGAVNEPTATEYVSLLRHIHRCLNRNSTTVPSGRRRPL
ncbi:hypothetical protein BAUCODRAFT_29165 [Baudoinia panamericana UAMH 10762]|uniref:Uncharacterized protein n=1 Tax=Baudoinia panamericana (strain UAMH 10762) TaxID=717646 RepID=M2MV18_BAUPA|nr:uncharacterized protein BAUCODRAFT_29165 [Baudoinia panamericana UAMH 10762]EMD00797.1 hypothetical protein BAUCODRAFT_29165 [Baudoinia panamericana UAMH 10762]